MVRAVVVASVATIFATFAACSSFDANPVDASDAASDVAVGDAPIDTVDELDAARDLDSQAPYPAAILADGPKAYWRMGTVTANVIIPDETGGGNDLTLAGAGFQTGAPGALPDDPAVYFSNTAEAHASKPSELDFSGVQPSFTLECWALQVIPDAGAEPFAYLMSHVAGSVGDKTQNGYFLYLRNDLAPETITAEVSAVTNDEAYVSSSVDSKKWTHYALVVNAGTATLYVDGAAQGSKAFAGEVQADPMLAFVVGGSTREPDIRHFTGYIDEVAIYAKALDATTIAKHHGLRP